MNHRLFHLNISENHSGLIQKLYIYYQLLILSTMLMAEQYQFKNLFYGRQESKVALFTLKKQFY